MLVLHIILGITKVTGRKNDGPSWSILRESGKEPFLFNWFCATKRFYKVYKVYKHKAFSQEV
eukprot:741372-Pelagomonas_calceolata.AAC.1